MLIIFVLTLLFYAFIYNKNKTVFQPTPSLTQSPTDQAANWKTYINKDLGFSINYPSNLYLYEEIWDYPNKKMLSISWGSLSKKEKTKLDQDYSLQNEIYNKKLGEKGYYSINIYVDTNPTLKPQYGNELPLTLENLKTMFMDQSKIETVFFQGRSGIKVNHTKTVDYQIIDGTTLIRLTGFSSSNKISHSYLDQILSTFKFTK